MSERAGEHPVTEREERFGHIVIRTARKDVYSLDLYETHEAHAPGISCKGYYLPAERSRTLSADEPRAQDLTRARALVLSMPLGVELTADPDAFNMIYEVVGGADFGREVGYWEDPQSPYSGLFRLGGPWGDTSPYFFLELSAPVRSQRKTVWTGLLTSGLPRIGYFDYVLEQYGTIDPLLALLIVYFLVFHPGEGKRLSDSAPDTTSVDDNSPLYEFERCYRLALRLCGEGNIKSLNSTTNVTGATLQVGIGCNPECFERWHPNA